MSCDIACGSLVWSRKQWIDLILAITQFVMLIMSFSEFKLECAQSASKYSGYANFGHNCTMTLDTRYKEYLDKIRERDPDVKADYRYVCVANGIWDKDYGECPVWGSYSNDTLWVPSDSYLRWLTNARCDGDLQWMYYASNTTDYKNSRTSKCMEQGGTTCSRLVDNACAVWSTNGWVLSSIIILFLATNLPLPQNPDEEPFLQQAGALGYVILIFYAIVKYILKLVARLPLTNIEVIKSFSDKNEIVYGVMYATLVLVSIMCYCKKRFVDDEGLENRDTLLLLFRFIPLVGIFEISCSYLGQLFMALDMSNILGLVNFHFDFKFPMSLSLSMVSGVIMLREIFQALTQKGNECLQCASNPV